MQIFRHSCPLKELKKRIKNCINVQLASVKTQNRNIIAKDLVKAAVNADKLPSQVLNDQNYLSAVNLQLNALPDYAAAD